MPGTDSRRDLGAAGEAAACAHLERRGYRILARNARADRVELDIVAERAGVLVFVEVKTRRTAGCGGAAEAVDARKQARIARGAVAWLHANGHRARRIRFDVVTCEPAPRGSFRVTHWESAFDAGGD
ncbi:MAG: YraN family protein [Deltaproteobacteria bacterium]|nr:MAG: YraN family protein [Deltaproteobacteria bacterium]